MLGVISGGGDDTGLSCDHALPSHAQVSMEFMPLWSFPPKRMVVRVFKS
jgi:hypothetical protein